MDEETFGTKRKSEVMEDSMSLVAVGRRSEVASTEFPFEFTKAKASVLYLAANRIPGLTKGKICKLIFLADKHHIIRYARPIIGDRYCALEHGPVPSHLLRLLDEVESESPSTPEARDLAKGLIVDRHFLYPHFANRERPDLDCLSVSDLESLDHTVRGHGHKSFTELRGLTHEMPAYKRAWDCKTMGANSASMRYEAFFDEDEEALAGVKEEMIENGKLRKLFPDPSWL